ncbi:MAG TPA: MBL fold metallo-hydrolase, partial [Kofleriaceae bacterium]
MKATYLGHACYAIRCAKRLILIDPLLTDVFQDGTAEVWPRRHIDLAAMPRPDVIVITHSHPGHLEVPSLALLPRSVPVFYPADPTIELVLEELGFATRTVVGPGDEIELDGATITMTGSTSGYPELGCLIQEGAASVWYLADTAVGPRDLQRVAERAERVDLLLGNYPGYHHKFFTLLDVS